MPTAVYTTKNGKKCEFHYLNSLPRGWVRLENATTAPLGFYWAHNGKSFFSGEHKQAIIKESWFKF